MSERYREFKVTKAEGEPVTFGIAFMITDGDEEHEKVEHFTCVPRLPATAALLAFEKQWTTPACMKFMDDVLADEKEVMRFRDLVTDRDVILDLETLGEVCRGLIEEYAGVPFEPSPPSAPGDSPSGDTSPAE